MRAHARVCMHRENMLQVGLEANFVCCSPGLLVPGFTDWTMAVAVPVWLSCISPPPALGLYQPSLYVGSVMEFGAHACAASPWSTGLSPQHHLADTQLEKKVL